MTFYVCVPVYKVEHYIDACIQSVLKQSYDNFQLILVDDGSPDRSGAICDQYADQDARIHVIHQENMGQIMARQAALERVLACTEADTNRSFVLFLDADDTFKPNALQTIYQKILVTGCDMLIYGADRVLNGEIVGTLSSKGPEFHGILTQKRELYRLVLADPSYNSLCRKAVSTDLITRKDYTSFSTIRHGEDLLQSLDYYKHAHTVAFIKEHLYNYTVNPQSVTQSVTFRNYQVNATVRSTVLQFIEEEGVWTERDLRFYMDSCRKRLFQELVMIAEFQTTLAKKCALLEEIRNDPYYSHVLSSGNNYAPTLNALKAGHFSWAILQAKAYSRLRSAYKFILRR